MKRSKLVLFSACFLFVIFLCRFAFSIEEYKDEDEEARAYNVTRTVKTVEGLHFLVEEDRPIEKIAGVYRPIDLDSYIALKFSKLQKKIDELAAAMQRKMYDLGQRLDALSKRVDELAAPPPAQPEPVPPQNITTNQTATTNQTTTTQ